MTDNIEKLSLANKQEIITIILKTSYRYEKVLPIILDSKNNKEPYEWMSEVSESHSVMSNSLWPQGLYSPWNAPGQNTGVGNLSLLQGIFPTQESNTGLLLCRQILYQLSLKVTLVTSFCEPPKSPFASNDLIVVFSILSAIRVNWYIIPVFGELSW